MLFITFISKLHLFLYNAIYYPILKKTGSNEDRSTAVLDKKDIQSGVPGLELRVTGLKGEKTLKQRRIKRGL